LTDGKKKGELVIKRAKHGSDVRVDLADYRAFISFTLIAITVFFAFTGNEAWREFAIMTGMAVSYWFGQRNKAK